MPRDFDAPPMIPEQVPSESPIGTVLGRLTGLQDQLRAAARRSWRFSWFSWGFLFALIIGMGLVFLAAAYALVSNAADLSASSAPWAPSLWVYLASTLPGVVLLALAVREIILGRREARTGRPRVLPSRREAPSPPGASWSEVVQRSQQLITQMRSETETAFIPLVLGGIGLASLLVGELLLPSFEAAYPVWSVAIYLLPVPLALLFIPFYLAVRGWIRSYQALLDRQVGSLSRLEQEFFTRFAGVAAGA